MPEQAHFILYRDTTAVLQFRMTDPDTLTSNVADWTTLFVVKRKDTYSNTVLSIPGSVSTEHDAAILGIFDVVVSKSNSALLTDGTKYAYSFRRVNAGFEDVLTFGELTARIVA